MTTMTTTTRRYWLDPSPIWGAAATGRLAILTLCADCAAYWLAEHGDGPAVPRALSNEELAAGIPACDVCDPFGDEAAEAECR